eukprot:6145363-Pyramimonas_sp.AAC.1
MRDGTLPGKLGEASGARSTGTYLPASKTAKAKRLFGVEKFFLESSGKLPCSAADGSTNWAPAVNRQPFLPPGD